MSQKYPYTNTGNDFPSHQDMHADSYQRQSHTFQPSVRSSSHERKGSSASSSRTQDSTLHLPGMALSFLHSCGLDPSDLAHLAELPEHLITVETLPKLLLQVKEHKLSSASSTRPSTSQPLDETSSRAWEGSSHGKPVEYLIDRPEHPVYPLPPEQVQTWQDRWGNHRRTSDSSVPDFPISKDTDPYYKTTGSPAASSCSAVDFGPRPLLSLKLEPPITVPSKMEASDFNCKIPVAFPHVCCLCDIFVDSTKDWIFHVRSSQHAESQLELVKKYPKWDQTVESAERTGGDEGCDVPTRKEASDFNGVVPPVFPYLCVLCNITVFSENEWTVHVTSGQHAKSQLNLMGKYPEWDGTVQSSRRYPKWDQTVESADRTVGAKGCDVPTRKEASDFNGVVPPVFPYLCVLCNITVFSAKEWTVHVTSGQHAKSQLNLMGKYPEWDGTVQSSRRNDDHTSKNRRDGTSRENASNLKKSQAKDEPSSRVVSFTPLPAGDGINLDLTAIANRFGSIKKSLFLPNQGFVEMVCSAEAKKLVEHYSGNQLKLKGKLIQVAFSCEYHSLRDAECNDKTQSRSSHTHRRSSPGKHDIQRDSPSPRRRRSSEKKHSSPKRRRSSERIRSSPKRRCSSERTHSSPKRKPSSEGTHSSPKRKPSSERTHSSPKRKPSSEGTHSSPKRKPSSDRTHSSPKRKPSSEGTHSSPKRKPSSDGTHSSPKRKPSSEGTHSSPKRKPSSDRTHSSPKRRCSSDRTHSSPKRRCSSERTHSSPKRRCSSDRTHSSPKRKPSSEGTHSSTKRKPSSEGTHSSPKRKPSSEGTHSSTKRKPSSEISQSSSKRRHSAEKIHSSPRRKCSSERLYSSPKRRHSSDRTHSSRSHNEKGQDHSRKSKESSRTFSHSYHLSSSAATNEATKSSADAEEKSSLSTNCVESMTSDSDLEGLEVIADDGEELVHDIDDSDPTTSDQENLPSEPMDITDVDTEEQEKPREYSPNADTSEASVSLMKDQQFKLQEDKEIKEEVYDSSIIPENCVTEENSFYQGSDKASSPKTEEHSDEVPTSTDPVSYTQQIDKESKLPEESICKTTADPSASENREDAVDQPKEEQDTKSVTDDLKETFGKVLEVTNLPSTEDYTDSDFMNIIKRYGDARHHVLFRSCRKGFVEMMSAADAERVAADSKNQDIALRGSVLKIKVSEKYCRLPEEGFSVESDSDDEEIRRGEISKESNNNEQSYSLNGNTESSNESHQTDEPVGTEFVRPVIAYFCRLCSVLYVIEEEAKDEHCRSQSHYEKVKQHKKQSGYVENKK